MHNLPKRSKLGDSANQQLQQHLHDGHQGGQRRGESHQYGDKCLDPDHDHLRHHPQHPGGLLHGGLE